ELWDLYEDVDIPMPKVEIPQAEADTHSQRVMKCADLWGNEVPQEAVYRARRAYYGACTYVDNQIGRLMKILKDCSMDRNTIIIFSGDHGDMLGERGMWYKMSWFEMSARVPLIVHYPPRFAARRVDECVSTMDLPPTMIELAGGRVHPHARFDAQSFYPALIGHRIEDQVFGEYMGEGTISPVMMIRKGQYKYIVSLVDEPQLFDLKADPRELHNAVTDPAYAEVAAKFADQARRKWDLRKIHDQVLVSQRQRRMVWQALQKGKFEPWDYEPKVDKPKYIRSMADLDALERMARYPPVDVRGRPLVSGKVKGQAGARGE
ncbi:hypothetical protein LTS18_012614, partial [Coniosporium uncinatum]